MFFPMPDAQPPPAFSAFLAAPGLPSDGASEPAAKQLSLRAATRSAAPRQPQAPLYE